MIWPGILDYQEAVQHPETAFRDPQLKKCIVAGNEHGLPQGAIGNFASVYRLTQGSSSTAVRLFHRPDSERDSRYHAILSHLRHAQPDCLVPFVYYSEGIRVKGEWYPMMAMEWVEGPNLWEWTGEAVEQNDLLRLRGMAGNLEEVIQKLQSHRISHGDLSHENMIIVDDEPILIDYDGMCTPDLVGRKQLELGLPAYQHPKRSQASLHLRLDDFSAWIIWIALRALAIDPGLWDRFVAQGENENLLFRERDHLHPQSSPLWAELLQSPDPEVKKAASGLMASLSQTLDAVPEFPQSIESPSTEKPLESRPRVFISHSTKNRDFVEMVLLPLFKCHGIDVWYAKDSIQTSSQWERDILQGLRDCEWFLVVLTPEAAQSEWVKDEIHWAMTYRWGKIIPVLAGDCDLLELHLRLPRVQCVDFRTEVNEAGRRLLQVWGITPAPP